MNFCHNPNSTTTQLQKLGVTWKWLYTTTTHPPGTKRQQYLSCYWPDFYQTFKVGFWNQKQQEQQQQQKPKTSWGWAVPSSGQAGLN